MKNKIRKIISVIDLISLTGFIILSVIGNILADSQGYNKSGGKWDSDGNYSQISCFLTEDSGFTRDSIQEIQASILDSLKKASIVPEENKTLVPYAYSSYFGNSTVRCDISGRSEAEITAVGGDFFIFRDFRLIDGAYFSESDLMQDGAVIDRNLAWALYGSEKVSGMNIYIDGVKFYISGVIENPRTKPEKKCAGEIPKIYLSYDGLKNLNTSFGISEENTDFKKVTCYECICPNPVENFAYNAVNDYFKDTYKYKYSVVNNSERFEPSERAGNFRNVSDYAVRDSSLKYPYWENASRIVEFKLTFIYFYRRICLVFPVITIIWLIVILWQKAEKYRKILAEKAIESINKKIYEHKQKKDIINNQKHNKSEGENLP